MSRDPVHPRDGMREAARRGVVPQTERDRTTPSERASAALRDTFRRQRARMQLPADDGSTGQ